jgi:hypothetical protein
VRKGAGHTARPPWCVAQARRYGVSIRPFPALENLNHDFGRDPEANATYLFTLGGLRVLHMGVMRALLARTYVAVP